MPDKVLCYGCGKVRCPVCGGRGEFCSGPCKGTGWLPAQECPDYWDACPMNRYEGHCGKRCAGGDLYGSDHMVLCPECKKEGLDE